MEYVRQIVECGGMLYEEYGFDFFDEDTEKENETDVYKQTRKESSRFGRMHGERGLVPFQPENPHYWGSYCSALRQFYLSQQGKQLTPGDPIDDII